MKKLFALGLLSLVVLSLFLASVSAYAYGGCVGCSYGARPYNDDYDSVSYHRINSNGYNTRYIDYDRSSSSGWYNGDYVRRTTMTRTTRDSPNYYNNYWDHYEGRGYRYDNDQYWYQRYWENQPANYGNPRIRYGNARYYSY